MKDWIKHQDSVIVRTFNREVPALRCAAPHGAALRSAAQRKNTIPFGDVLHSGAQRKNTTPSGEIC